MHILLLCNIVDLEYQHQITSWVDCKPYSPKCLLAPHVYTNTDIIVLYVNYLHYIIVQFECSFTYCDQHENNVDLKYTVEIKGVSYIYVSGPILNSKIELTDLEWVIPFCKYRARIGLFRLTS
jgi:hypothetical protein